MSVRLTDDEAWDFISSSLTGVLSTLRRDGFPVTLPVWFVVIDKEVYLRTSERSKKVTRIRHDSRASFLAESGTWWTELKAVSFTAVASIVTEQQTRDLALSMLGEKYRGRRVSRTSLPDATVRHYSTGEAIIRLTPQSHLLTWDNSKIAISG